uniref:40S ribosomal protein S27 n=1 Tax=Oryzias sinensis TaxID=183150 RepID=A0A8C7YPG2_9TELE
MNALYLILFRVILAKKKNFSTSCRRAGSFRHVTKDFFSFRRDFARRHARCYKITTVFSHAQTVVLCVGCSTVLCQPTGGKARLTEGCSFRRKQH